MQSVAANSFNCLLSSRSRGGNTSCDYVVILSVRQAGRGVNSQFGSRRRLSSSAGPHVSCRVQAFRESLDFFLKNKSQKVPPKEGEVFL